MSGQGALHGPWCPATQRTKWVSGVAGDTRAAIPGALCSLASQAQSQCQSSTREEAPSSHTAPSWHYELESWRPSLRGKGSQGGAGEEPQQGGYERVLGPGPWEPQTTPP